MPDSATGVAVLVLAGSSGRVDSGRAEVLARNGAIAESVRWFGGQGQSPGPYDVPLELFLDRVSSLAREADRVVVVGTSFGSEAALLTGAHSAQVDAVVAFAPSDVTWAGVRPDGRMTSHWALGGRPLPYVPLIDDWEPQDDPPTFVGLYEESRRRSRDDVAAAALPVEVVPQVVLVAGGDDHVWPSLTMSRAIESRRAERGLGTTLVTDPAAGHRTILPGEEPVAGGVRMRRGGSTSADRGLGAAAWPHIAALLGAIDSGPDTTAVSA